MGMVSHELQTPLTSIRGSANTLLDEASSLDPAEMRQFHRIISDQADRMRSLIRDLLSNAAKYSNELSSITVRAVLKQFQVVVSVADEGRGIPATRLPLLFRKFSRVDEKDQQGDLAVDFDVGSVGLFDLAPRRHPHTDTVSPEKSRSGIGGHGPAQLVQRVLAAPDGCRRPPARSATCPTCTLPGRTCSHTVMGHLMPAVA